MRLEPYLKERKAVPEKHLFNMTHPALPKFHLRFLYTEVHRRAAGVSAFDQTDDKDVFILTSEEALRKSACSYKKFQNGNKNF